ncbi:hydrocephalus-inducing protein-like isoform X1 [Nyctibius grandis]|uniref:hydrocephalus-inducing protein-like isoform X1 n=1 Tax=Nyctibius grandis TaxID=48427 RepID=UPI0035BC8FC1
MAVGDYEELLKSYELRGTTNWADFQTEKTISMARASPGGSEVSVEVTYEPCQCHHCNSPPQPSPRTIKAGGTTSIPFKTIFLQPTAFQYTVDHPVYVRATKNLHAKKTTFIRVSFERAKTPSSSSKMVVSCPGRGADISWVYCWTS